MKLVLEGGGARAAYSAGVVHALAQAGVRPKAVLGCSSGSINAAFCASEQTGTLVDLWSNYVPGKHFISWRRQLTPFGGPGRRERSYARARETSGGSLLTSR